MSRTYLFVPWGDEAEARAAGALWDRELKCWYAPGRIDRASVLSRWVPGEDEELFVVSNRAWVVCAWVPCQRCRLRIQVICMHFENGMVKRQPFVHFTVSHISAMNEETARQLKRWPQFHISTSQGTEGRFLNHCDYCGTAQDELLFHADPDHPFFEIMKGWDSRSIRFTALEGTVRVGGEVNLHVHSGTCETDGADLPFPPELHGRDSVGPFETGSTTRRDAGRKAQGARSKLTLISIDPLYRCDQPGGITLHLGREQAARDLELFWVDLVVGIERTWQNAESEGNAPAFIDGTLPHLHQPATDTERGLAQLADIYVLERAGLIMPDEHNGIFLSYRDPETGRVLRVRGVERVRKADA